MNSTSSRGAGVDPALGWSQGLSVEVGGAGTVAQAGIVLPRLLADRVGLTTGLSGAVARAGFIPLRDRGRALTDAACALAAGASCLSDIEAMTAREEIFGPGGGASDTTMLRVLNELAAKLGADGLPGRKLAKTMAGAREAAWAQIVARHGQLPAVKVAGTDLTRPGVDRDPDVGVPRPVLVVRLDATLIEADSTKTGAAGNYKGGFGFHPLTAWCSNVGDSLAVMLRPGNAGSFTASDHILVLDAAIAQIPAAWRTDVLVTIDGAGASHDVINHLTALNTAAAHGRRGRRIEYSIGWPVDERTQNGIGQLRESDWTDALSADGTPDPHASVADLTGILRHGPDGDKLAGWPADLRIIARRVPRPAGEQARLGEHPDWRYGASATNTATGQTQRAGRPAPHPGPRRRQDERTQDLRRRQPAVHRLGPQQCLATTGGAGLLPERLAASHRPRRATRQSRTQSTALPTPRRPRPPRHPRPPQDPENPTRLELGTRPCHRLSTTPSPPPRLNKHPCPDEQHHPSRPVDPAPTRAHRAHRPGPGRPTTPHSHRISRSQHRNTTVNHPGRPMLLTGRRCQRTASGRCRGEVHQGRRSDPPRVGRLVGSGGGIAAARARCRSISARASAFLR